MELDPIIDAKNDSQDAGISAELALQQIADLCKHINGLQVEVSRGGRVFTAFEKSNKSKRGILSIIGESMGDSIISLKVEVLRAPENIRISMGMFCRSLSSLGNKCRVLAPSIWKKTSDYSYCLELQAKAVPLSAVRANALLNELKRIDELAKDLQKQVPAPRSQSDLDKLFEKHSQILQPVYSWNIDSGSEVNRWAEQLCDFMSGSLCIAVASPFETCLEYALSALSKAGEQSGRVFGRCLLPAINAKAIVDIAREAPGTAVVPASRISLGTSPYELGNEMQAMLAALSSANTPVLFTGTYEQLQGVFHGGQGGQSDPLCPVVMRVPEVSLEDLAGFAIWSQSRFAGGIPQSAQARLCQTVISVLREKDPAGQKRFLPAVVGRAVSQWSSGKSCLTESSASFVTSVSALSESLAGLSAKPRVSRAPAVQEHFTRVLTDPGLLCFLQEKLLAQDAALRMLVERLRAEILTRPEHQPVRYCAQGTPATGKSASAVMLADSLNVPYVNIDAASMPDYHTAAAQLLGSGRGIVGSHQSGRLEQAAKHHQGVLLEISDLDHAVPSVRSALADLFLQVLETGEAQSATGAMFSCSNIIFSFTMNLPEGMDEALYRSIGFGERSKQEIAFRVSAEIKRVLSSAFLSRVGTPILFEPLTSEALATIVERAVRSAVRSATEHLQIPIAAVELEPGIGEFLVACMGKGAGAFGARGLLELGRVAASDALLCALNPKTDLAGKKIRVRAGQDGNLVIDPY
ncbi:MAG: AAA family ATPase [Candidatus Alcyoniella australis]|nr:AAA family ATPase [Candidatus Alcyoniella australis]